MTLDEHQRLEQRISHITGLMQEVEPALKADIWRVPLHRILGRFLAQESTEGMALTTVSEIAQAKAWDADGMSFQSDEEANVMKWRSIEEGWRALARAAELVRDERLEPPAATMTL